MPRTRSETRQKRLIEEYQQLCELDGVTPQIRGQRFNGLVAEMLANYGYRSRPNNRGRGEIDVAFEIEGTRFVLEAKWEKKPVDEDPISKLRDRVKKRLAGTVGILLSMTGFTQPALTNMLIGQRLEVLLITREHFEAMIFGFLSPEELFSAILDNAHFHGHPLTRLADLRRETHGHIEVDWKVAPDDPAITLLRDDISLTPLFRVQHNQHLQEANDSTFFVSQPDGVIKLVKGEKKPSIDLGIPSLSDFIKTENGYLIIRGDCMGKFEDDSWQFSRCEPSSKDQRSRLMTTEWRFINGLSGIHKGRAATPALATNIITGKTIPLMPNCRNACIVADKIVCLQEGREGTIHVFDFQGILKSSHEIKRGSNPWITPVDQNRIALIANQSLSFIDIMTGEVTPMVKANRQLYPHPIASNVGLINFGVFDPTKDLRLAFYRLNQV